MDFKAVSNAAIVSLSKKRKRGDGIRQAEDSTIVTLKEHGASQRSIAETLGVSEGTVRYRLSRLGCKDRRRERGSAFDRFKGLLECSTQPQLLRLGLMVSRQKSMA